MAGDAFAQNKRRFGKGLAYFIINATFCIFFAIALFTLGRNQCYSIKSSNYPVSEATYLAMQPNSNNVTAWYNWTCLIGFLFYGIAAVSSLGYLTKSGPLNTCSAYTEKLARMLTYFVFIAVHVMRFSHTGSVCAGDYLQPGVDDQDVSNYMIATGRFFMMYIILGWIAVPIILIITVCIMGDKWAALALDAPK